jgi:hydrogenase nickel incorporation protein HypA/HybF
MHEYSVVDELIASLLPRLTEHRGDVTAIFLKKGELRILSDRALENAFAVLRQGTRLAGARLVVERIDAVVVCSSCGYEGTAKRFEDEAGHFSVPVLSCPSCGADVRLLSGRELYVDRVSLSDPSVEGAST